MKKLFIGHLDLKRAYTRLEKTEFFCATSLFILGIIMLWNEGPSPESFLFGIPHLKFILWVCFFYLSFLLVNFVAIPGLIKKTNLWLNLGIIAAVIGSSIAMFPKLDENPVLVSLTVYFVLKFSVLFVWQQFNWFRQRKGDFSSGILLAGIFYLLLMFLMLIGDAQPVAMVIPGMLIPFSIGLYAYSYQKLIPSSLRKKRPFWSYFAKVCLVLLLTAIPLGLLTLLSTGEEDLPVIVVMMNIPIQILFTLPVSWYVFKRHMKGREAFQNLQKELGQSTAKFDILRSQINPHFLFNALNTLYGTAIQEKAERTGEGIQLLGDMMRFMLHENMQEKISLEREIEYLENYISLQRLRTDPSPQVRIEAEIEHQMDYSQISPMLLIPFVENAFKHGISFREPSHIKITLEKKEDTLFFDVYNSKHHKLQNDPERDNSGIGLTNVKQRLELLYPDQHELHIRETSKEFFVHLSLELTQS